MSLRATVQLRLWPLLFLFACASAQPAPLPRVHFWFAMHPGSMVEFDPVTDTVLRTIPFQHGMPWGITLTHDEQRFLVVTDQQRKIEVVDRAQGKVTEVHRAKVTRTIKGEQITRNATEDEPAYLIEQEDGSRVLKSRSEVESV